MTSQSTLQLAAKNDARDSIKWFVADLAHLPLNDHSIDCILNIFSPANYNEFSRILLHNGYVIKIVTRKNHLKELREKAKKQLKNDVYSNQKIINYFKKHFSIVTEQTVTATYKVSPKERDIFLKMTPLLFHVNKDDIDWTSINSITIEAELLIGHPQHP